jgi:murein DD-endopeptidase MepM/ murein hydrolase activator NlpD
MRKKISFLVLSNTSSMPKQITVSTSFLIIAVIVGLAVCSYMTYDYFSLKAASFDSRNYQKVIDLQKDEIVNQRRQIQGFAKEITSLKKELVALNGFENKVRIIANLEKSKDDGGLFGVGGSIPEDIDAKMPLSKKHNSLIREMHNQVDQLKTASIYQKEGFNALFKHLEDKQNLLACTPAIQPVKNGWITSRFGWRTSPFTGIKEFHKGYDISNRKGTSIMATANGTVSFAGSKGLFGKTVVIDHGHGMLTRYCHCNKLLKKQGDKVKRGDIIATVGNTGKSTGPHVHYEVHLNGIPVNPGKYILN